MGKRLLIFITVLLIVGITAGWYFFAKESRYLGTSPLKAVPIESPFFVRIRNLGDFADKTVKSNSWQSMSGLREISELYKNCVFIDSLILQSKECENFLRHKELIVVPVDSAKLYLLEIGSITEKNSIKSFIRNFFLSRNIVAIPKEFKGASMQQYEWNEKGEKRRILVTFYRGMLMVGNDTSSLKMAIEQMDQPSVLEDVNYLRVNKNATENIDLNIYINHKTFPAYLSQFYADSLGTGIFQPNYAKWTEVDVIQKENQLLINGFTVPDTTLSCYLNVFKHQKPMEGTLSRLMPAVTTFFVAQSLSQPMQYFEDYNGYLLKNGKLDSYRDQLSTLSRELNVDIRKYLNENWSGEAAAVYTNHNLGEPSDNRFFLMKVKTGINDPLFTALKKWVVTNKSNLKDSETTDAARNNIWKVPCENFGNMVGEFYFGSVKTKWMTFGDGFILMGATPGSLKRYLSLLKRQELLPGNHTYAKFTSGLARTSNFYMWSSPGESLPFFESVLRLALYQNLKNAVFSLKKVENIAWQWGYENGMIYNTACININPAADQDQVPFWRYQLKAKIRTKPVFVSYSVKNQEKELVFQDVENNLIDLDKEGIERWKIRLNGPILGEIKLIDYHKNGEFQLLFNTGTAIHLVSRDGVEIKNYPVILKSVATNEISVFDYEGKKDYRYMIACRDHKVYNFDKTGKLISGWQPKVTGDFVELPVRHFRIGSRDYIVFFDRNHTYILDRQGKDRVKMRDEFVHSKNNISLITTKGERDYMVTTDDHGKIRLLSFDGSTRKITTGIFSSEHYFLTADISGDGNSDYVFFDKQNLSLYDFSGSLIFSYPVPSLIDQTPKVLSIGNEKIIELYSTVENRTILVKKDGSIFDIILPAKCSLLSIGSFDDKAGVSNILAYASDGFLSNFQMILP